MDDIEKQKPLQAAVVLLGVKKGGETEYEEAGNYYRERRQ